MNDLRVLIADDEEHARVELENALSKINGIKVLKSCITGDEALEYINKLELDIIILDIDMPGIDGISLGKCIANMGRKFYIIYVTAYDKYAIEALNLNAKGYILKPFKFTDIFQTISKAKAYYNTIDTKYPLGNGMDKMKFNKITYKINDRYVFAETEEMVFAYAKDRSVYLRINEKDYLCNETLNQLELRLDPKIFFRCHRNYIINVYRIKEVIPWFNSTYLLIMNDKARTEISVSRSKIKEFNKFIRIV